MKSLWYCILCIIILTSCHQEQIMPTVSNEYVELSIVFKCRDIEATRALSPSEENQVKDINIYLIHRSLGIVKHQFTSGRNLSINVIGGEYTIYTIANIGYDMGYKAKAEIENFSSSIANQYDIEQNATLVMSNQQTVSIGANTNISIILERIVAKIDVSVTVKDGFDFNLQSMQVINAPSECSLFQSYLSNKTINYNSVQSFYMYENLQGVNNNIKTEQQKNRQTAPSNATYIHIIGTSGGNKVEYFIYLGENNTTDFNVYRNKNYTYDIYIKGINEVDNRVNVVTLSVDTIEDKYVIGEPFSSAVNLSCVQNVGSSYYISFSLLEGNGQVLINNNVVAYDNYSLFLSDNETSSNLPFQYVQSSSSKVRLLISVKDNNDLVFNRELATSYVAAPLTMTIETPPNSRGGLASVFSFTTEKANYNDQVKFKYELTRGVGTVKYNNQQLQTNTTTDTQLGENIISFTPSELQDAELKLTITLLNGETVSKKVVIKVVKMTIEARREIDKGDKQYYRYSFYVDNIPATLYGDVLPPKSCMEIRISTNVSWICNSCNRIVRSNSETHSLMQMIKPETILMSKGYWLNTLIHPTTISIINCGNPNCPGENRTARLDSNSGTAEVLYPVTKFVNFINL